MRRLFGTDGIRGKAGEPPLDAATVSRVGAALAASLGHANPAVVVGCDTRESSGAIVWALTGGLTKAGGLVRFAGVVPTPAVAFLAKELGADAGVVVSASHNPWTDNGVKIFSGEGRKLPDDVELEIERHIDEAKPAPMAPAVVEPDLGRAYVDHLVATLPHRLDGLRVVIDAANGAAFEAAPAAFAAAGATVIARNASPDGRNINEGCGALHPGAMRDAVRAEGADLGIALDGDADRIIVADDAGTLLDGDDVLFLWTLEMEREGKRPASVVGTVMSNWGLETALAGRGVALVRAAVGDRYVVEEMEKSGALLGGEQSGHLIRADLTTTGDGTLTGLHLAALVAASGMKLSAQPRFVHTPQVLKNVKVKARVPFEEIPGFAPLWRAAEAKMSGAGRILLRYSGTEALARVMVEGRDAALVDTVASDLAAHIGARLGA
ncbi:MAG TPA: phosphoglucosamine mutase [Thermoanaerobaculia bacterium]|nr:phosphoglucosamine mutase [Thermoanaerobaculia bacterium]